MKRYIKASPDYLIQMTDDELEDLYIDIIDQRERVPNGTPKADYLDDLYYEVISEIGARKRRR